MKGRRTALILTLVALGALSAFTVALKTAGVGEILPVGRIASGWFPTAPSAGNAGQIVLLAEPDLDGTARRLVAQYLDSPSGLSPSGGPSSSAGDFQVREMGLKEALAALKSKKADLVLAYSEPDDPSLKVAGRYNQARVIGAPWMGPTTALTLEEAQKIKETVGNSAFDPRLLPGGVREYSLAMHPVAVDGVLPTLANIRSGKYPLSRPVYLIRASKDPKPGGSLARFLAWLSSSEGQSAFYDSPPEATLTVFGDIMLSRGVESKIKRLGPEQGPKYPFETTGLRLASADLTFANLESPFGVKGAPIPGKGIWFRADPALAPILSYAGVDVVTVANNHILDYDTENFLETLEILDKQGVAYVGGGRSISEARKPLIKEVNGVRIAFLGYSGFAEIFWDRKYPRMFAATETRPGVAPMRPEVIAEDVKKARGQADIVAVAYHWGEEYVNLPSRDMVRLAHQTVDAGADLVLGFHPHAIQGFELYKGRFIAYSLGNFVMDQKRDITRESMILELALTKSGVRSANIVPVMIEDYQPRILEGADRERLWKKMREISAAIAALQP